MKELITKIKETMQEVEKDLLVYEGKAVKNASLRVRRNSLKLEKLFKEFRKQSIEADKK